MPTSGIIPRLSPIRLACASSIRRTGFAPTGDLVSATTPVEGAVGMRVHASLADLQTITEEWEISLRLSAFDTAAALLEKKVVLRKRSKPGKLMQTGACGSLPCRQTKPTSSSGRPFRM